MYYELEETDLDPEEIIAIFSYPEPYRTLMTTKM